MNEKLLRPERARIRDTTQQTHQKKSRYIKVNLNGPRNEEKSKPKTVRYAITRVRKPLLPKEERCSFVGFQRRLLLSPVRNGSI